MNPIETRESNFVYLGPSAEIADLPCCVGSNDTFSIWEFSEAERKLIAEGANIRMGIHGVRPIPPVSLQVVVNSGVYERVLAPCRICGKEVDDPVHLLGSGTHAFKSLRTCEGKEYVPKKYG